jgi:hypothetical protein
MSIYEQKAETIKKAVTVLENAIIEAQSVGLKVSLNYDNKQQPGYQYIETVIVLPILNLP